MDRKRNFFAKNGSDIFFGNALWRRWIVLTVAAAVLMVCLTGCRLPIPEEDLTLPSTIPDPTDMEHTVEPAYDPTNFEDPKIDLIIENPESDWD